MFQKFFATLLTYVIGAQLILSSVPHGSFSPNAWAESCASGLQWSDAVGRCVTSDDAAKIQNANAQCAGLGTQELKKKCYEDAVKAKITEAENDGTIYAHQKVGTDAHAFVNILIALGGVWAGIEFMPQKAADCPVAYSAWALIIGAVAVVAGEIASSIVYKKKLKDAEKEVQNENKNSEGQNSDNTSATDTQSQSFNALLARENATISAAKLKKTLYTVALIAYGVAFGVTIYELIMSKIPITGPAFEAAATCYSAAATNFQRSPRKVYAASEQNFIDNFKTSWNQARQSNIELFLENYFTKGQRVSYKNYFYDDRELLAETLQEFILISSDKKKIREGLNVSSGLVEFEQIQKLNLEHGYENDQESTSAFYKISANVAKSFYIQDAEAFLMGLMLAKLIPMLIKYKAVKKKMYTSIYTRMALSGVMTLSTGIYIKHINKQIDKAEERKSFISNLQAQVNGAGTAFGCTTADRNSNLSKPNCYCYTESGTLNPSRSNSATCKALFGSKPVVANNKTNSKPKESAPKTCMTNKGAVDDNCGCNKTKSCATFAPNLESGSVPSGLFGSLPSTLNGLSNGSLTAADVDENSFQGLAARAKAFEKKILSDPKNKKHQLTIDKARADAQKFVDSYSKKFASDPGFNTAMRNFGMGNLSGPTSIEKMKEDLKQEIKGYDAPVVPVAGGDEKKKEDDFNLGIGNEGEAISIEEEKLAEVMNSEFDMSAGEINGDSGANIFDILTNRYQRSGMRRLFGGEAMIPADKPNETEISQ